MFRSTKPGDSFTHGRVGANDPDFNLRRDPVLIHHRATASDQSTFVSIIDSHGEYSPVTELSTGQRSRIRDLKITLDTPAYTVANIALQSGDQFVLAWAHTDFSEDAPHEIRLPQGVLRWVGPQAVEAM
jgi:hypothetical protein